MRENVPPRTLAVVLIVSVLARPGTPSISRCPCASRHTSTRSSIASCPAITRRISKSACSRRSFASAGVGGLGGGSVTARLLSSWAVSIGDFATTTAPGTFALAYLVANTIMNLTTQEEQVVCFRNVAAHLEPGGCFVIEVLVPRLQRLPPGETFQLFDVSPTHVGFDEYDLVRQ